MLPLAVATGGAALLSYLGQQQSNDANVSMAREASHANLQSSRENRAWQERMSNTSHQREMQDLKMAGLNPLLTATGGAGASTPSGSTAQAVAGHVENAYSGALTTALEGGRMMMDLKTQQLAATKQAAEIDKMEAEKKYISTQTGESSMRTKVMSKEMPKADLTNRVYNQIEPLVKKMEESLQWNARKKKKPMNQTPTEFLP